MTINWNQLRPWNGDQRSAFEELCCQLAAAEAVPPSSCFIRKGTPDAGVECYWKLPTGEEWGWQAKFLQQQLGTTQWKEIDESFFTAFEAHPNLTKYIVCLPQNLPDGRTGRGKTARQRWEDKKAGWIRHSARVGRTLTIELWDETQIGLRLARADQQGTHWFWFADTQRLTLQWFGDRLDEAISNAGDRYTPEAHTELPVSQLFAGLGRCPGYCEKARALTSQLHQRHRTLLRPATNQQIETTFSTIDTLVSTLSELLHTAIDVCLDRVSDQLPLVDISECAKALSNTARSLSNIYYELTEHTHKQHSKKKMAITYHDSVTDNYRSASIYLRELSLIAEEIDIFYSSNESHLTNRPALLLEGKAGQGKTHLLCDIAQRDYNAGRPRIVIHGSHFLLGEPWKQIVEILGLDCDVECFMGGLQACAQALRSRILIFIDAINEGVGPELWPAHLAGFLKRLKKYPWLGICMTVRSTYTDLFVTTAQIKEALVCDVHRGFEEHEEEAVARYFSFYGIAPTYPLLVPEFSIPLFLKLFCQAIKNHGLTHVPPGIRGITTLLTFFLDSINRKLSRTQALDYNESDRLVHEAVSRLCRVMADKFAEYLPRADAESIVNSVRPSALYSKSLFKHLVDEGLLNVDRWRSQDQDRDIVHFAYQRFADHLMAAHLLDTHVDQQRPKRAFSKRSPLGRIFHAPHVEWKNRGLIEALSIQLPERIDREFTAMVPHLAATEVGRTAFTESIVWRASDAFSDETKQYINGHLLRNQRGLHAFFEAMLTVAPIPNHPYNADRLHSHLQTFSLPERDAWWSIFLHDRYIDGGAISRLIKWAWDGTIHQHFDDEVVRLSATALIWFLTSSNRFLRDCATKGLVRILSDRLACLQKLIEQFHNVNDPYVAERLYAVAYGCAMRCQDLPAVSELALDVYARVFEHRQPPVHIRLRDYARGIIELALSRQPELPIDATRIHPPYSSRWPEQQPQSEELLTKRITSKSSADANGSIYKLVKSITSDMEDFCKYVIDDMYSWSNVRLGETPQPTRKERVKQFKSLLTPRQLAAYEEYRAVREYRGRSKAASDILEQDVCDKDIEEWIAHSYRKVRSTLGAGSKKWKVFEITVCPYLDHPYGDDRRFDVEFARKWILQRVVELGWTADRFGMFDQRVNSFAIAGRSGHKAERIGKKYQWISYCELLAMIADNFQMKGEDSTWNPEPYCGPWQINRGRDIDPSLLMKEVQRNNWEPSTKCWWFQLDYAPWHTEASHMQWLKNSENLPDPTSLLFATLPTNSSKWIVLDGYYVWEEPSPLSEDRFDFPRRQLRYWIRGYLVRSEESRRLFQWISRKHGFGQLLREGSGEYNIYLGEFFWSPAYLSMDNEYHGRDGWTSGGNEAIPSEILSVSETYVRESGTADCSIDDTVFVELPCKEIVSGMKLCWGGKSSEYVDKQGHVITFDPSVNEKGPGCLLVKDGEFQSYLNAAGLEFFWIVTGEKIRIGGQHRDEDYLGRMDIFGCYRLSANGVSGKLDCKYKHRET